MIQRHYPRLVLHLFWLESSLRLDDCIDETWTRWQGSLLRDSRQEARWSQWGWVTTLLHWMLCKCSCSYDKVEHVHESSLKEKRHRQSLRSNAKTLIQNNIGQLHISVQLERVVSPLFTTTVVSTAWIIHGASLYMLTLRKHVDDIKSKFSDSRDTKLIVNRRCILVSCHLSSD